MKKLPPAILAEIRKCIRCGECRTVCPVFADLHREKYASRGKLALVKAIDRGQLRLTPGYGEVIDNCLLCLACVANCSSGVRLDKVITAARAHWAAEKGLPVAKRTAYGLLKSPRAVIDTAVRGGSLAQSLLFDRLPRLSGLHRRFPTLVETLGDRYVPRLAQKPLIQRRHDPAYEQPGPDSTTRTVIFFSGCLINYVFPRIGEALIKVFRRLGLQVVMPADQSCCGTPAKVGGDLESARQLARNNIARLAKTGAPIVTACGSCGRMLRSEYASLFDPSDPVYAQAQGLAGRVHDVSEYLIHHTDYPQLAAQLRAHDHPGITSHGITYHEPCHLGRGMGVTDEPREVLNLAAGNEFTEMAMADRCCGSGGLYGLTHPQTSRRILQKKIDTIDTTGAGTVATGCPGCLIQLTDGMRRSQTGGEVLHTIEVVARLVDHSIPKNRPKIGNV